jgi:hypothetical protein
MDIYIRNSEISNLSSSCNKTINNINGEVNRYVIHKYWARIDTSGKYKLGPINVWQGLDLLGKQDVVIEVQDPVKPVITRMQVKKSPVAELVVDKPTVYVGEQFVATIRLYFSALKITAAKLDFITDMSSIFDIAVIGDPKVGFEVLNQEPVDYLEWQLNMSAKNAGDLAIPVIGVIFEQAGRFNSGLLFGNYQQTQRLTNAVKLVVKDLPPTKHAVQAVGEFDDFIAQIDHDELKDGQVAQLNLTLVSNNAVNAINWDAVSISNLVLPANLQAYAGSVQAKAGSKTFEFVLQGLKTGESMIPVQDFFYFDPVAEQYKTLKTKPIKMNILAVPDIKNAVVQNNMDQNQAVQVLAPDKFGLDSIITAGTIRYAPGFALPMRVFIFLALIPVLILLGQARFKLIKEKFSKNQSNFKIFEKQLANLEQHQNQALLYNLFGQILVQKFKLLPADLNKFKIDQLLKSYSVPEQARSEFNVFYDQIAQAAFAGEYQSNLFELSRYWLNFLKKLDQRC